MTDLLSQLPNSVMSTLDTRFAPKLSNADRCGVLALHMHGVNKRVLAAAFGINRRTVSHITNPHSKHYKEVRRIAGSMPREEFIAQYVTEEMIERIKDVASKREVDLTDRSAQAATERGNPSRRAKGKQGIHVIKPPHCKFSHRIEIAWREEDPVGWWYRDLDSSEPDEWLNEGPESLLSSQNCYNAAFENLIEE